MHLEGIGGEGDWRAATHTSVGAQPDEFCSSAHDLRLGFDRQSLKVFAQGQLVPQQIVQEITYTEPAAKGDTATNVTKPVKVETGAEFLAPAFINEGDVIRVNTDRGDYITRVSTG